MFGNWKIPTAESKIIKIAKNLTKKKFNGTDESTVVGYITTKYAFNPTRLETNQTSHALERSVGGNRSVLTKAWFSQSLQGLPDSVADIESFRPWPWPWPWPWPCSIREQSGLSAAALNIPVKSTAHSPGWQIQQWTFTNRHLSCNVDIFWFIYLKRYLVIVNSLQHEFFYGLKNLQQN